MNPVPTKPKTPGTAAVPPPKKPPPSPPGGGPGGPTGRGRGGSQRTAAGRPPSKTDRKGGGLVVWGGIAIPEDQRGDPQNKRDCCSWGAIRQMSPEERRACHADVVKAWKELRDSGSADSELYQDLMAIVDDIEQFIIDMEDYMGEFDPVRWVNRLNSHGISHGDAATLQQGRDLARIARDEVEASYGSVWSLAGEMGGEVWSKFWGGVWKSIRRSLTPSRLSTSPLAHLVRQLILGRLLFDRIKEQYGIDQAIEIYETLGETVELREALEHAMGEESVPPSDNWNRYRITHDNALDKILESLATAIRDKNSVGWMRGDPDVAWAYGAYEILALYGLSRELKELANRISPRLASAERCMMWLLLPERYYEQAEYQNTGPTENPSIRSWRR